MSNTAAVISLLEAYAADFSMRANSIEEIEVAIKQLRHLERGLKLIADHATNGIGCNPEGFVRIARAALDGDASP